MSVDMSFFRCTNVRVDHTYVGNSNSIQLNIEHDGGVTEITLYNLPSAVTDKFAALRDERTSDYQRNVETMTVDFGPVSNLVAAEDF